MTTTTRINALSERINAELIAFARNEWAQMGAYMRPRQASPWAQDPEALVLFALGIAGTDRTLHEVVFDWLFVNHDLISTRRLRTLAGGDPLGDAVLTWMTARMGRSARPRDLSGAERAFVEAGIVHPLPGVTALAKPPKLTAPINLAFRLRELLGFGARAEAVRCLLTSGVQAATAPQLARAAGYSARNVHEALSSLARARVATMWLGTNSNEQRFGLDRDRWAALLGVDAWPEHRNWPPLLDALRRVHRRLSALDLTHPSTFDQALRELLADVHRDFTAASAVVHNPAADPFEAVQEAVERGVELLRPGAADH